jgi:hypothetical protein
MAIEMMLWKNWAEVFFIVLLLLGFLLSIAMPNPWISYLVIFSAGLLSGRWIYKKKGRQPLFPFFLIIVGFLLGYMLGAYPVGVDARVIVLLFIVGALLSYFAHKKDYIKY